MISYIKFVPVLKLECISIDTKKATFSLWISKKVRELIFVPPPLSFSHANTHKGTYIGDLH